MGWELQGSCNVLRASLAARCGYLILNSWGAIASSLTTQEERRWSLRGQSVSDEGRLDRQGCHKAYTTRFLTPTLS